MLFENYVKTNQAAFLAKVKDIAAKLSVPADWLMGLMWSESGLKHNGNPNKIGAVGLIQFTPATATWLGTSTSALRSMTNVQQLDYVYKFFSSKRGQFSQFSDFYLYNFVPIMLGKPDNTIIAYKGASAGAIARDNSIFDLNKDKQVTIGEFRKAVSDRFKKELKDYPAAYKELFKTGANFLGIALLGGLGYYLYKTFTKKKTKTL